MASFFGHWYSGRAARLCVLEAGLAGSAVWVAGRGTAGTAVVALVAAAACVPAALYLADLYDPQVMRNDRGAGVRTLRALGFACLGAATVGLAGGASLRPGALLGMLGVASIGALLLRALLVAQKEDEGPSRLLVLGNGPRATEIARLVRTEAWGEYEVAGTLDPAADLKAAASEVPLAAAGGSDAVALAPSPIVVPAAQTIVAPGSSSPEAAVAQAAAAAVGPEAAVASAVAAATVTALPVSSPMTRESTSGEGALAPVLPLAPQTAVLVPARSLKEAAAKLRVDTVVLASDDVLDAVPPDDLIGLRLAGVTVLPAQRFAERALRRIPLSLLRPADLAVGPRLSSPLHAFFKRAFDLLASGLLTLLAAPVLGLLAVLIKLDSEGPVFYGQERLGRGGKPYTIHKLRTMRQDAEKLTGPVWASQKDPRVTRLGAFLRKTRLDEIPQVLAVLRGDMSFVGPRPERPFFVSQLKQQIPLFGLREAVKPGITGWAQIRYPYGATVDDARAKLEYDLYYVEHQSVFLDLAICFHTVKTVLFGRGAR